MGRGLIITAVLGLLLAGWPAAATAQKPGARNPSVQNPAAIQQAVNQGQQLMRSGRANEAEPLLRRAAEDAERLWGATSPDAGTLTILWADALHEAGRTQEAEAAYRLSLSRLERVNEPGHPMIGLALNNLGLNLHEQGRYAEALAVLERAVAIRTAIEGEAGATLVSMSNRAVALKALGRFEEADLLYERVLAARRRGGDPLDLATTLNNLGANRLMMDRPDEAETALREALALREAGLGGSHPLTAQTLSLLADALAAQGRFEAAAMMQRRALDTFGPDADPVERAAALANLADILKSLDRNEEALPLDRAAFDLTRTALGTGHPETLGAMIGLADSLLATGAAVEARPLLVEALRLQARALGPDHPARLQPLFLLGVAEGEAGDRAAAIAALREAARIADVALPPDHLARIGSQANLGAALAADRKPDEALPLLRTAGRSLRADRGRRPDPERTRRELEAWRRVFRLTVTAAWDAAA
ncbi:tetratricopeptide repeat protein [Brevundimonas sp.]|uniref:tetratricopeptide repeat protein n=1 Tax=Brevundimonas sp. TaxID=1871086 RepID=UPI002737ABA0|nr:tetratricopeptide repeat protein [Brevundimonas sp.]MDP3801157.1 tetratricopeptide repeat protein [Brevundimonas sp.]